MDSIFTTEKGFCVSPTERPFVEFYKSRSNLQDNFNGNIVSLLPWLADIVFTTIQACNEITHSFASVVLLPPDIAPGYKIFVRDPSNHAMIDLLKIHNGASPWWKN